MRISGRNARRRLEHGKAVLLGFEFKSKPHSARVVWTFTVPEHVDLQRLTKLGVPEAAVVEPSGWVTGFFAYRHQAVTSALMQAGLLEDGTASAVTGRRTP